MKKEKSVTKEVLDPNSEYFRICPECGEHFMADNMQQVFSTPRCKDRFNNRIKYNKKIADKVKTEEGEKEGASAERERKRNWTIAQLDKMQIDHNGIKMNISELHGLNIDLSVYDTVLPFPEFPNCHYITIGGYHICLWTLDTLIIQNMNRNNKLTIQKPKPDEHN